MADQTQRLEIATVKAEIGSDIIDRFTNDALADDLIPTDTGDIQNLKQVVAGIQEDGAEKISFATTIYSTTAAGIAATTNGAIFLVKSDEADEIYAVWQNVSGVATDTGKRSMAAQAIQDAMQSATDAAQAAEDSADLATARTARFLASVSTPPVIRDDGTPLQLGDRYVNAENQAEYIYKSSGWVVNDSLEAIAEIEDATDPAKGAAKVGSILPIDGAVGRKQSSINWDRLTVHDFGLVGDGSDETAKLLKFFAAKAGAGKSYLQRDKTYGFSGTLALPPGLDLITNGSTFRRLATAASYGITVPDGVSVDNLRLSTPGGPTEGGINVMGSDCNLPRIKFTSDTPDCGSGSPRNAVLVQASSNNTIGKIYVANHSKPTSFQLVDLTTVGRMTSNGSTTGCYCIDVKNSTFKGARHSGVSPSAVGTAGQNALLVEATTDFGSYNLRFEDWHAEDSPEHGFRLGGQYKMDNIHLVRCTSKRAGSGSAPTGGSGFKVLGPNGRALYHTNIFITNCTSEDAGQVPGDNFNALDVSWIDGLQVAGFTSRKKDRPYASTGGIRLSRLKNTCIDNPIIRDPLTGALRFIEVVGDTGTVMENVTILGGILHRQEYDVITLDCKATVYKNVHLRGTLLMGGRSAIRPETPLSGGAYTDVSFAFTYVDPTDTATGNPAITGGNDILYDVTAPWYGSSGAPGKDGSIYRDTTNGLVRTRVAGAWVTISDKLPSDGTWTPTLTSVTNIAASLASVGQFMRVGNTVTISGSVQIDPTATGAAQLDMSLPVPSNFTGFQNAAGFARTDNGDIAGTIEANTTTDVLSLKLTATTTNNRNVTFQATYRIL